MGQLTMVLTGDSLQAPLRRGLRSRFGKSDYPYGAIPILICYLSELEPIARTNITSREPKLLCSGKKSVISYPSPFRPK